MKMVISIFLLVFLSSGLVHGADLARVDMCERLVSVGEKYTFHYDEKSNTKGVVDKVVYSYPDCWIEVQTGRKTVLVNLSQAVEIHKH